MSIEQSILDALPEIDEIDDPDTRETVLQTWTNAFEESEFTSLEDIPWWPPLEEEVNYENQISHLRQVTAFAISITDQYMEFRPEMDLDRDLVIAGALLHDISKLYETDEDGLTELDSWLPHPHYSIHPLVSGNCPLHLQHIVLAHTDNTNIDPQTLEAEIVRVADELAVSGMLWEHMETLEH